MRCRHDLAVVEVWPKALTVAKLPEQRDDDNDEVPRHDRHGHHESTNPAIGGVPPSQFSYSSLGSIGRMDEIHWHPSTPFRLDPKQYDDDKGWNHWAVFVFFIERVFSSLQ